MNLFLRKHSLTPFFSLGILPPLQESLFLLKVYIPWAFLKSVRCFSVFVGSIFHLEQHLDSLSLSVNYFIISYAHFHKCYCICTSNPCKMADSTDLFHEPFDIVLTQVWVPPCVHVITEQPLSTFFRYRPSGALLRVFLPNKDPTSIDKHTIPFSPFSVWVFLAN